MPELTTTLTLLRKEHACRNSYTVLRKALGTGYGQNTPITILRILETNGMDDALWALRAVPQAQGVDRDRFARLLACDYAERVLHLFEREYPADRRPRQAIDTARRFALGEASSDELSPAWDDAFASARDAAGAARAAAWDAKRAADAAWDAAGAARSASEDAAAWASGAARSARDASGAARSAGAAWDDAWAAACYARADEMTWQIDHLIEKLQEETHA